MSTTMIPQQKYWDDELDRLLGPVNPGVVKPEETSSLQTTATPAPVLPARPDVTTVVRSEPGHAPKLVMVAVLDRNSPYYEKCSKCGGTGSFTSYSGRRVGPCFHCEGMGGFMRKTTAEQRAATHQRAAVRKAGTKQANLDAFAQSFPQEYQWLTGAAATGFEFASSILEAIKKYGDLTEKQFASVCSATEKARLRNEAKAAPKPMLDMSKLAAAFEAARVKGLKKPILRFEGFTASLAPSAGRNAGAIYLKDGSTYLGKIVGGQFTPSYSAADAAKDIVAKVQAVMADPVAAAVAYGRSTGQCSCCGRKLTDPVSVANGIGPICAAGYGF